MRIFCDVCAHRIVLSPKARLHEHSAAQVLAELTAEIPKPGEAGTSV